MNNYLDRKVDSERDEQLNSLFDEVTNSYEIVGDVTFSDTNVQKMVQLTEKLVAELTAAYESPLMDEVNLATKKLNHLWAIFISVVVSSNKTTQDYKWLRFLLSEKVPRQRRFLGLRLFLRTTDFGYVPKKYISDQVIASMLGNINRDFRESLVTIKYLSTKVTRSNRKRHYTDGKSAPISSEAVNPLTEWLKDETSTQLHNELLQLKSNIELFENLLVSLSDIEKSF
jgi:hypothetical protein